MDIEELKKLAEAAGTEHRWNWHADPIKGDPLGRSRYEVVTLGRTITRTYYSDPIALNEAAYIAAANPQTVLELLSRIEQLHRELEEARRDAERRLDILTEINDNGYLGEARAVEMEYGGSGQDCDRIISLVEMEYDAARQQKG